jgi:RNA polymerase sigma-70 factor (ECF subfamily)
MEPAQFADHLAAAQRGDEDAFAELFRCVQPQLLRYLHAMAGGAADDVAAETWVSVIKALHKFRGDETGWRSWVFTIARARLVDARRQAARVAIPVDTEVALGTQADPVDVTEYVEELVSTEFALALIGQLPRDQAEAVLLRHVAGLDVPHVAHVLGKRPGAVRVATHRGLKRLAQLLDRQTSPPVSTRSNAQDSVTG